MRTVLLLHLIAAGVLMTTGCRYRDHRHTPDNLSQAGYSRALASPGAQFGQIPPAVQNTVRAQAGAAPVSHILTSGATIPEHYVITFENPLVNPPLFVLADGSVMNPDLTTAVGAVQDSGGRIEGAADAQLRVIDLPPEVQRALRERTPQEPSTVSTQTWGTRKVYILEFPEAVNQPRIYISSDGTVMKDSPE